jgi:hypothetical protein
MGMPGTAYAGAMDVDFLSYKPGVLVPTEATGVVGDFNGNGILDTEDINILTGESASGENNTAYDLNADQAVNELDVTVWAKDLFQTWIGDVDLDKTFGTPDLLAVFQAGLFESGTPAVWTTGDWNGDGIFGTGDMLKAFQDGGFEQGPFQPGPAAVSAVPEPSSLALASLGLFCLLGLYRRR